MQVFRTPESRFEAWTDFPYKPNYLEFEGIRMHYVDEGPASASPALPSELSGDCAPSTIMSSNASALVQRWPTIS